MRVDKWVVGQDCGGVSTKMGRSVRGSAERRAGE